MKPPTQRRQRPGRPARRPRPAPGAAKKFRGAAAFLLTALLTASAAPGAAGPSAGEASAKRAVLRVEAEYIAYSFDRHAFIARNASFDLPPYRVSCGTLRADLSARAFLALGGVVLTREGESLRADALSFDPAASGALLLDYGDSLEARSLTLGAGADAAAAAPPPPAKLRAAEAVSLAAVRGSLLYAVCRSLDITPAYDAFGRDVVLYVEGLESVGFRSLKLSAAEAALSRRPGLSLNSLWFSRDRGIRGRASYSVLDPGRADSLTRLEYEEHSVIKDFPGPARQADLTTDSSWTLRPDLGLGFRGNANTSGLLDARLWLDKSWAQKKLSTRWDLTLSRPVGQPVETWLGLKAAYDAGGAGRLAAAGRLGSAGQAVGDFSYAARLGGNLDFQASSLYTRVRRGADGARSSILDGRLRLSYTSRLFNLASDYHLNADLAEGRTLRSPQLRMESGPLPFYGGLLQAGLSNVFIHNTLGGKGSSSSSYSNNTAFRLSAAPVPLARGLLLDFSLALEQFLEKEGRNFTSGGAVVNLKRRWPAGVTLEGFYSLQSRRRTRGGLLEGTTSQDLSGVLRLQPSEGLNAWVAASYDPKNGRFKQSFADLTLAVIRGWRFHSLLQYDFVLNKLSNVDLYLIRDAGRFELRLMWRSLSRQFLVELLPK
ncbi:MAG: hypothetical protein FJY83_01490 [Candidatus Aminicenantes bacterium]|nr:hypothetical protein [Candidatus Aminicenantes bacterium]